MLLEPRVVRRALDREVERDLEPVLLGGRDEPVEVLQRPQLGMDRVVPSLGPADRPRAPGIALRRDERVVAALPVRRPDRVDRRQVDDVEAELRELRHHLFDTLEPAPGAREELVPAAEPGALALDVDLERRVQGRLPEPLAPAERRRRRTPVLELAVAEQRRALGELAAQVILLGRDLPVELVDERRVRVDPCLDRVLPASEPGHLEGAAPVVVAEELERLLEPLPRSLAPIAHDGPKLVVPVLEDVRRELDPIADRALDRVPATVDLGLDVLDLDAWRLLLRQGHASETFSAAGTVNR